MTGAISLTACKSDMPSNTPYLMSPNAQGLCARYKLVDAQAITYQFDSWQPCSDVTGGWALPKGQLESLDAWARQEIKNCQ